jgi:hypothetical protein
METLRCSETRDKIARETTVGIRYIGLVLPKIVADDDG